METLVFSKAASEYARLGWFVYPACWPTASGSCGCGRDHAKAGKAPLLKNGHKGASANADEIARWEGQWPKANVGIALDVSGLLVVDLDGAEACAEGRVLGLPETAWVKTGNGEHWYFLAPYGMGPGRTTKRGTCESIDVLADGGIIAPPSLHATGMRYEWRRTPAQGIAPAPQWAVDMLLGVGNESVEPLLAQAFEGAAMPEGLSEEGGRVWRGESYENDRSRALASLSMHLARIEGMSEQALVNWLMTWDIMRGKETGKGPKYALRKDADLQYTKLAKSALERVSGAARGGDSKASKQVELADAYCSAWPNSMLIGESWFDYDDGIWNEATKYQIEGRIQELMGPGATAGTVLAVERLLRARLVQPHTIWATAPDVIVCQNGAVDVDTGGIYDQSPEFYARRKTDYFYDKQSVAPTWLKFIEGRFEPEVGAWLQEFVGVALTRDMGHEVAVWLYSPPGAGKSTFIAGVRAALGPAKCGKLSLGDIARNPRFALVNVPGKTLLEASEQPSAFLDSSDLLNSLISGDTLTIEAKHQNPFEWTPTAKLLWGMNELPSVGSANDGIFRRVKIVKMVPLEDRDPAVRAQIEREGAGILNWAMEGLRRLRLSGQTLDVREPQIMREWRRAYQSANDIAGTFVEERVESATRDDKVQAQALYDAYYTYCIRNGFKPKSRNKIATDWARLGFEAGSLNGRRFYRGVRLRNSEESARDD